MIKRFDLTTIARLIKYLAVPHVIIRMGRLTDITMIHHKTARVGTTVTVDRRLEEAFII